MFSFENGSLRLFRFAGINVYVHWTWLLLAAFEARRPLEKGYDAPIWGVLEYVAIFAIVLLHEFGHALACRQVGGAADRIVLWPLGGIAFVNPPPRPGAVLWSIAAGPLVNVFLVPITVLLYFLAFQLGWHDTFPNLAVFVQSLMGINLLLLMFNILPIYPLDGGQIVQALLWFVIGRAQSLMIASVLGVICGLAIVGLALWGQIWLLVLVAFFMTSRSWIGIQQARALAQLAKAPRHTDLVCPSCGASPLKGAYWRCNQCNVAFDTFASGGVCPNCSQRFPETACPECRERHAMVEWIPAALPVEPVDERVAVSSLEK